MQTDVHCMVAASASTGGPSSAGSKTQHNASTINAAPASQSPNASQPTTATTSTHVFMTFFTLFLTAEHTLWSSLCRLTRGEHRPPASLEFRRGAVVTRCGRHRETMSAGQGALAWVGEIKAQAFQQPVEIRSRADVTGSPMIHE